MSTPQRSMTKRTLLAECLSVEGGLEEVNAFFQKRGWSDGLPLIPPTPQRVQRFLKAVNRDPQEVIGLVPPHWGKATVEKIAINAVMAGCAPEYMPLLIAIVDVICEEDFHLAAVQSTTHPCAVLTIINGPVRKQLDVNCSSGVFGPGWRANATIGRAVRLMLINIGGGFPGVGDMATQGQPSKYTYCIAENEEESPWEPLLVERGLPPDRSAVSVVPAENPRNMVQYPEAKGSSVLVGVANACAGYGTNNAQHGGGSIIAGKVLGLVVGLCPEQANLLARDGYSKENIKEYVWEHARVRLDAFPPEIREWHIEMARLHGLPLPANGLLPMTASPDTIQVIVIGGPGSAHSCWIPTLFADMKTALIP